MIFIAYAVFLVVTAVAFSLIAVGRRPTADGSTLRVLAFFISLSILLLSITLVPEQDDATSLGMLIVGGALVGSALFAIGAANWTGTAAFCLRAAGWLLATIALAIPSMLTMLFPLIAVLAFAVAPTSRRLAASPRSVAA